MLFFIYTLVSVLVCASCDERSSRRPRFFSFMPEGEDVEVGLDFSIPFIKIPVTKTFDAVAAYGLPGFSLSKININPMAVVLGSMIIFFVSVFGPVVNKAFGYHGSRLSRAENPTDLTILNMKEHLMVNSGGCPERLACWISQRTRNSESIHTWKEIMNNKLISSIMNTTALTDATMKGVKGYNCETYTPCPIQEEALEKLSNSVSVLTRSETRKFIMNKSTQY